MKRVEITFNSITNELFKLNEKLEKAEANYQKKLAKAEKLGVADMDADQHREWLQTVPTNEGWIANKEDIQKNGAWYDLISAENRVGELKYSISKAEARLEKAEEKVTEYHVQMANMKDLQLKEELMKLEFEAEQKEWAKDGITLKGRYWGITPQGKKFNIYGNNGFTTRSLHCVTLYINGETIFTSGEFWRAYGVVKNS